MMGLRQFGNVNFLSGMIVLGAFVVPLSVVVLFFELNVPGTSRSTKSRR